MAQGYIIWDFDPIIFTYHSVSLRWYGALFAAGFLISQQILYYIYRKEGKPERDIDILTIYMVFATVVGARLGHVLFYQPGLYLHDPMAVFRIWEGGLASHGAAIGILLAVWLYCRYRMAIFKDIPSPNQDGSGPKRRVGFFFIRRQLEGQSYLQVLDRLVIVIALTSACIRFGNFLNSEIVGTPTSGPSGVFFAKEVNRSLLDADDWGAVTEIDYGKKDAGDNDKGYHPVQIMVTYRKAFVNPTAIEDHLQKALSQMRYHEQHDPSMRNLYTGYYKYDYVENDAGQYQALINSYAIARHPAQLYECLSCLIIFVILLFTWHRSRKEPLPPGRLLGLFLVLCFSVRFLLEFIKENQASFESHLPINMGQILSIPLIIAGAILLIRNRQTRIL